MASRVLCNSEWRTSISKYIGAYQVRGSTVVIPNPSAPSVYWGACQVHPRDQCTPLNSSQVSGSGREGGQRLHSPTA
jgi:hypothetical protein